MHSDYEAVGRIGGGNSGSTPSINGGRLTPRGMVGGGSELLLGAGVDNNIDQDQMGSSVSHRASLTAHCKNGSPVGPHNPTGVGPGRRAAYNTCRLGEGNAKEVVYWPSRVELVEKRPVTHILIFNQINASAVYKLGPFG